MAHLAECNLPAYTHCMRERVRETLRAAGLRRTPARERVLSTVESLAAPVTHGDLAAHPDLADIDEVTLYRTLSTLVEAELVHRVHGLDGAWRYCIQQRDRRGCPGNHPHFLCTSCGSMDCLVDQPLPRVAVPEGSEVLGRQFLVHGRCAACAAARATPSQGESS